MRDDLESGSDRGGPAGRQKSRAAESEMVYARLSPRAEALWKEVRGLTPVKWGGPIHAHGFLAASRFVLEKLAMEYALGLGATRIADVGGCPKRNAAVLGGKGWYVMPNLQRGDTRRWRETPAAVSNQRCTCPIEKCTHVDDNSVLVFIHSAYYLSPDALWALCRRHPLGVIVVGHYFDSGYGGLLDECKWEIDDGLVRMQVTGNPEPYTHSMLPWNYGWRGVNGEKFEIGELARVGPFTRAWEVHANYGEKIQPVSFADVLVPGAYTGPVQFSDAARAQNASHSRFADLQVDLDHVYRLGPVFLTDTLVNGSKRRTTIPVELVGLAASFMVGKRRDADGWLNLRHYVNEKASRMNIPVARRAEVVTVCTGLGFTIGLETESDVLYTVQSRFGEWFKFHGSLIAFQDPKVWTCWGMVGLLSFLTIIWLTVSSTQLSTHPVVAGDATIIWAISIVLIVLVLCCARCVARRQAMGSSHTWNLAMRSQSPHSPLSYATVPLLGPDANVPGTTAAKPIGEISGTMRLQEPREQYLTPRNVEKPRLLTGGIAFSNVVPTVFATTQEVEASAVAHRILRPKPQFDMDAVSKFEYWVANRWPQQPSSCVKLGTTQFTQWIAKVRRHLGAKYADTMQLLLPRYKAQEPGVVTAGRPFLKLEKGYTVGPSGGDPSKPRLIQPPVDDFTKLVTGIVSSQIYARYCDMWDGVRCPIFYASGHTTDHIGFVVDQYLAQHPNAKMYKNDFSSYDACLGIHLQHSVFRDYSRLGVDDWALSHFTCVRSRGVTPTGVEFRPEIEAEFPDAQSAALFADKYLKPYGLQYTVAGNVVNYEDFQMCSGRGDTNLMDTIVNAATFDAILRELGINDWLLLVNGDDASLLIDHPRAEEAVDRIRDFQTRLGLITDGQWCANRAEWEFCSKLFWYGVDPKTGLSQTVLGPKPGRALSRMGFNTTVAGTQNVAGAAISLKRDAGHVPLVSSLAKRTYELCAKQKLRPIGREEWGLRSSKTFEIDPRNWVLLEERYSVSQESVRHFEALLAGVHVVPVLVNWEPLEGMAAIDA